jgi:hypothetical protein
MNCEEFQKALPYIVDGGGTAEQEAHLKTCAVCSDLVQDLRYIAEQAKLLVPMQDPNPRVWAGIQTSLEKEGLVRPPAAGRFHPAVIPGGAGHWGNWTRWGAVAAIVVVAFALVLSRNGANAPEQTAANLAQATNDASLDANDQKLLAVVAKQTPERAEVYKKSLHEVNAYIADAKKASDRDPSDDLAREHLMQAYGQKEMLYDMATNDTSETSGPAE